MCMVMMVMMMMMMMMMLIVGSDRQHHRHRHLVDHLEELLKSPWIVDGSLTVKFELEVRPNVEPRLLRRVGGCV